MESGSKPIYDRRSRQGCWTCRRRKKKCDNSYPCGNCKRLGLKCENEVRLVWEDDTRREGMKRRGPPVRKKQDFDSIAIVRATADASERVDQEQPDSTTANSYSSLNPSASSSILESNRVALGQQGAVIYRPFRSFQASLGESESLLLDRYIQKFSRTYPTCADASNPFLSVLLPISARSPVVLDSMLALSGAQMRADGGTTMQETALSIRQRALSGCRRLILQSNTLLDSSESLTSLFDKLNGEDMLALLVSCVLLLLYEKVCGEGKANWMPHMDFIHRIWSQSTAFQDPLTSKSPEAFVFLRSLFLYNDLVRSTSLRAPTHSDFYMRAIGDEARRYYYPCLVARISAGDRSVTENEIAKWDGRMDWLPSFALSTADGTDDEESRKSDEAGTIADLYRAAATIYRRQRHAEDQPTTLEPAMDLLSTKHIASWAIEVMQRLPEGSEFENALLWPTAIIARELDHHQAAERAIVLRRLGALKRRFQLRHFTRAQELLLDYWERIDHDSEYKWMAGANDDIILLG